MNIVESVIFLNFFLNSSNQSFFFKLLAEDRTDYLSFLCYMLLFTSHVTNILIFFCFQC